MSILGFSGDEDEPKSYVSREGNLYIARVSVFLFCMLPLIRLAIVLDLLAFFTGTAPLAPSLDADFDVPKPGHFAGALLAAIQPHSVRPSGSGGFRTIGILSWTILASGWRACLALYSTLYMSVPGNEIQCQMKLCLHLIPYLYAPLSG